MKTLQLFRRRALVLFFTVSLIPAVAVGALWFVYNQASTTNELITIGGLVAPVAFLSLIPAIIISIIFAEFLTRPIKKLQEAMMAIRNGDLSYRLHFSRGGEFGEMAEALNQIASRLQTMLSEANTETEVIAAERNKLRAVLDSMQDGVFAIDSSNRIILFNKAASDLTGRTIAEVAGQLAEKVMPLRRKGELVMAGWLADRVKAGRDVGEWRGLELYRSDGSSLTVNVHAIKLPQDPNGIKALVTFQDTTKDAALEELKVDFVALAAHELRTPVTTIRGYLDLLKGELQNQLSVDQLDLLARSITSSDQLAGLINNLLNVSRIERGALSLNPITVAYGEMVSNLAVDYHVRAKDQHRQLVVKVPKRLPAMKIDVTGITEVLNNLIENAILHTKAMDGVITIAVHRKGENIETTITDNGSGIPRDAIHNLFKKFYRVEGLHTTRGTGLGLYISKGIVEAHGGTIWVESVEGEGSTFGFNLPIKSAVAAQAVSGNNKESKSIEGMHGWLKNSVH